MTNPRHARCKSFPRRVLRGLMAAAVMWTAACAPQEQRVAETITTRIRDPFLRKHVQTQVDKGAVNPQTDLYEVDAMILTDQLDANRPNSYRVFVRAQYFQGQSPKPVDTSQWYEMILQPGQPTQFESASLTAADRCLIEVVYPEEVGLK